MKLNPANALLVVGSVAGGLCGWLNWTVSGSRTRNSYATFRALQILGLDSLTPVRVIWFLTPVAALAVITLIVAKRSFPAAVLAALLALVLALVAGAVQFSGASANKGPVVALISASALAVGAALTMLMALKRRGEARLGTSAHPS